MLDHTVIHLANVLAIAEADGTVVAAEEAVLRDVVKRLGATEADITAAYALLDHNPPYRLRAFPEPSARMAVVEDMVMMSMADGQISPHESRPLDAFLESLGYAQADIDMIVRRVRTRLAKISTVPLPQSVPPPPFKPPPFKPPSIKPPSIKPSHKVSVPAQTQAQAAEKPAARPLPPDPRVDDTVDVPEVEVEPADLTPLWQACAHCRGKSPAGTSYCFGAPEGPLNPWGCRLTDMPWADDAPWLRLGRFRDSTTFVFDRDAIATLLRQRLVVVSECPFLLPGFAYEALAALPARATVGERWRPHVVPASAPGATRLTITTYAHGCARQSAVLADGVTPTSDYDARLLIRRTVCRTGAAVDLAVLDVRNPGGRS